MPTRILFLSQGRASPAAALGHVRVEHALAAGLPAGSPVAVEHAAVPPFTLPQRLFIRPVPRLGHADLMTLRWHLARGWAARRALSRRLRSSRARRPAATTDQVSFLLGRLQRRVPCVLSLDITTYDWVRLLRRLSPSAAMPADLRPLVALERRALHAAPLAVAWTRSVAERIERLAPRAQVATLHPGLDLEAFRPRSGPRPPGPLRVLFVGGRWEAKGGPELVAALDGELGRTVELHVVTTAAVPPREGVVIHAAAPGSGEVSELFRRADVLCLPSHVDAVPWVLVEALASGVPIVASQLGSMPELAGDGCGLVVAPGDVDGLRAALRTLLEDPDLRRSLGEAGRARAEERYDARRNTPRLIELLADVAAQHARRAPG